MQLAYGAQPFQIQTANAPNQGAEMRAYGRAAEPARSVFRLHVHNVPQYLSLDEFRNQFMKVEGCFNAAVDKNEAGIILGHYVDFVSQEFAEKCASTYSNWKGWGPKGLAFQRLGHVATELKRPQQADGDAYLPAKHARMAARDEPPQQKQDGLNSLMQLASGAHYQMNSSGMPRSGMQPSTMQPGQDRGGAPVGGGPATMYQRSGAAYTAPTGPGVGTKGRIAPQVSATSQPPQMQTLVQPSMQQGMPSGMVQPALQIPQQQAPPSLAYQQQPQTVSQYAPPQQPASQQARQQLVAAPVEAMSGGPAQAAPGMQQVTYAGQQPPTAGAQMSVAPANVQYIQLADGTIRAMVPVQAEVPRGAQLDSASQELQKAPTQLQAPPLQVTAPAYLATLNSAPVKTEYSGQYSNVREQPAEYQQMVAPPDLRPATLPDPVPALEPAVGGRDVPIEITSVPDQGPALPADATETLYVEDVPTDMSKRELAHIFRPFGGFKEVRIVNKTKDEKTFSFAFAEFETAECAAAALSCLHGYQFDPDTTALGVMHLRYARGGSVKGNTRGMNQGHQDGKPMRQGGGSHAPNARKAPAVLQQQPNQAPPQRAGGGGHMQRPQGGGGGNRGQGNRNNQGGRPNGQGPRNNNGWRGGGR